VNGKVEYSATSFPLSSFHATFFRDRCALTRGFDGEELVWTDVSGVSWVLQRRIERFLGGVEMCWEEPVPVLASMEMLAGLFDSLVGARAV